MSDNSTLTDTFTNVKSCQLGAVNREDLHHVTGVQNALIANQSYQQQIFNPKRDGFSRA